MLRRILLGLGVVFAAVGFAVTIDPSLATTLGFPPLPPVLIAGLAAFFALTAYVRRRHTRFRDASDDEQRNALLEARFEAPRPGADVDERLRAGSGDMSTVSNTQQFKDRVRTLAVQVLVDAQGLSPEEANEHLDAGTWTDDEAAASYFAEDIDPPAEDFVGSIVGGKTMYERQAGHVVHELRRIAGVHGGGE